MQVLRRPLQILYVIYAFVVFVILMIPVFIWSLAVLPMGRIKAGNLIYYGCVIWADIWFFLLFIRHHNIYLEKPEKERSYIYVLNHISYLDSAIIPKAFRHPVKPLGKVEMARIPIFGFIYKNVIVTVDRSSSANRSRSVYIMKSVLLKGISVLVFPEGTFNLTHKPLKEFYDGAFRIAIETGTPIKPVLLMDAYSRMHYASIFTLNPGKSRALFLPSISVEGLSMADVSALKEKVFAIMQAELIKQEVAWISGISEGAKV